MASATDEALQEDYLNQADKRTPSLTIISFTVKGNPPCGLFPTSFEVGYEYWAK